MFFLVSAANEELSCKSSVSCDLISCSAFFNLDCVFNIAESVEDCVWPLCLSASEYFCWLD